MRWWRYFFFGIFLVRGGDPEGKTCIGEEGGGGEGEDIVQHGGERVGFFRWDVGRETGGEVLLVVCSLWVMGFKGF